MKHDTKTLLKMLQGLRSNTCETPPPGFYTKAQLAKDWGCSESHAKVMIGHGLDAGKLKRIDLRVPTRTGGIRRTPHYGPA
jgi:hypothetical protein